MINQNINLEDKIRKGIRKSVLNLISSLNRSNLTNTERIEFLNIFSIGLREGMSIASLTPIRLKEPNLIDVVQEIASAVSDEEISADEAWDEVLSVTE